MLQFTAAEMSNLNIITDLLGVTETGIIDEFVSSLQTMAH